jgi:hypothetical protein
MQGSPARTGADRGGRPSHDRGLGDAHQLAYLRQGGVPRLAPVELECALLIDRRTGCAKMFRPGWSPPGPWATGSR